MQIKSLSRFYLIPLGVISPKIQKAIPTLEVVEGKENLHAGRNKNINQNRNSQKKPPKNRATIWYTYTMLCIYLKPLVNIV